MVKAILDGRKSCTRRIVKPQQLVGLLPDKCKNGVPEEFLKEKKFMFKPYCDMTDIELIMTSYKKPYQPGDILYVRETFIQAAAHTFWYKADGKSWMSKDLLWKPSIHMPKEAARIWLKVTNVRVERLQEITVENALAEGVDKYIRLNGEIEENAIITSFIGIWNSTIKKSNLDFYGWDANPWVWVIEFERCDKPESEEN
jgi:hypothetical protein